MEFCMKKEIKDKIMITAQYPITLYDTIWDMIICRTPLYKYVPSKYRESHGQQEVSQLVIGFYTIFLKAQILLRTMFLLTSAVVKAEFLLI